MHTVYHNVGNSGLDLSQICGVIVGIILFLYGVYRLWNKGVDDGIQTMSLGLIPISTGYAGLIRVKDLGISGMISAYLFLLAGIMGTVWYIRDNVQKTDEQKSRV